MRDQTQAIKGGQPAAEGAWPAVVGIVYQGQIICTGTLIHPQVVLTAAHCLTGKSVVDTPALPLADAITIYSGPGRASGLVVRGQYAVDSIASHPDYDHGLYFDRDFAVIKLKKPIEGIKPIAVPKDFNEFFELSRAEQPVQIVGFGWQHEKYDALEVGTKFEATTKVYGSWRGELLIGDKDHDVCYGDSGGPAIGALAGGGQRTFGVVSRGATNCGSLNGEGVHQSTTFGAVSDAVCWIESATHLKLDHSFPCGIEQASSDTFLKLCLAPQNLYDLYVAQVVRQTVEADGESCEVADARLRNSTALDFSNRNLSDIRFVAAATGATSLKLFNNNIRDVSWLANLTHLSEVDLAWNQLGAASVTALRTSLRGVSTKGLRTQQTNFLETDFLKACLDPAPEPATKKSVQAILAEMGRKLSATGRGTGLTCESANLQLVKTTGLNLVGYDLTDLSVLSGLELLDTLDARANEIDDLAFVRDLPNLKKLSISNNPLLRTGDQIAEALMSGLQVTAVPDAPGWQSTELYQGCLHLEDPSPPANVVNAVKVINRLLQVKANQALNREMMHQNLNCKSLLMQLQDASVWTIDLSALALSNYSILAEFHSAKTPIYEINLTGNGLKDVGFLKGLAVLELKLGSNALNSGEALVGMRRVNTLDLSNNQITDFSFLKNVPGLLSVDVHNNPAKNFVCPVGLVCKTE